VYRFALRPWWIVSHLVVLAIVVAFVNLGMWQLRRLDEVRDRNAHLAERIAADPAPIEDLVPAGDDSGSRAEDHRVTATGRYRPDEAVLIRGRSLDDRPGSWVVVPLELPDGRVVAVNRGWIRNDGRFTEVPEEYRAVPEGDVAIEGLLHATQERGALGASDPADGVLRSMARVDLDRLDQQVDGDLLPVWVQLTAAERGAPDPSPELLDPPITNDEGPHLSYAIQWGIFTVIALVGYPLILRRAARDRGRRHPDDAPGLDDPDPDDRPGAGDPRLDAGVS
jgi:cytochrome oxidase assembly protein ShyY1